MDIPTLQFLLKSPIFWAFIYLIGVALMLGILWGPPVTMTKPVAWRLGFAIGLTSWVGFFIFMGWFLILFVTEFTDF